MKKIISFGICLCLLTVMLLTACEDAQTTSGGENSSPVSSENINTETSSEDTSSKETSSKNESTKEDSVSNQYSNYTIEEFIKLDIDDDEVAIEIKKEYVNKDFSLSDFPEVDGIKIHIYDVMLDVTGDLSVYITLKEHSKQGVFEALKALEKNQYVSGVNPLLLTYAD